MKGLGAAGAIVTMLGAGTFAGGALAGAPVSPGAGAVVTTAQPEFVVDLRPGDAYPQIQVATSPHVSGIGLTEGRVGLCIPDPPAGGGGETSCRLFSDLPDGTYYWALLFQRDDRCISLGGKKVCLPQLHVTVPVRFRVATQAEPPAPTPQPPAPSPPPPGPIPVPAGHSPSGSLPRPTAGGRFGYATMEAPPYVTAGAVVHYVTTGLDAPPLNDDNANGVPDYVEQTGAAADSALAYYGARGFRPPLVDSAGPDGRPDIYIKHFSYPDLFGLTFQPSTAQGGTFVIVSSHLDLSPKLARASLAGTVAHELFHVIQYAYLPAGGMPSWVAEGSASAMAVAVEPKIEDLVSMGYLDQWLSQPWRPLFDERFSCDRCYGGAWWWGALTQDEPRLLPQYFSALARERLAGRRTGFGLDPLDALLRRVGKGPLDRVFFQFALGLYRSGYQPSSAYALHAGRTAAATHTATINPLAMLFVPLVAPPGCGSLDLSLDGKSKFLHATVIVGGRRGRVAARNPIRLRKPGDQAMLLVTSGGLRLQRYRLRLTANC